jgi:hypothetical protein
MSWSSSRAAERYRQKVADIHAALSRGETGDREAIALVRSLIGRIVVHATPAPESLGLEVEGSLAALMTDAPELEHSGISCCMPTQPSLSRLPGRGAAQDLVRGVRVTGSAPDAGMEIVSTRPRVQSAQSSLSARCIWSSNGRRR